MSFFDLYQAATTVCQRLETRLHLDPPYRTFLATRDGVAYLGIPVSTDAPSWEIVFSKVENIFVVAFLIPETLGSWSDNGREGFCLVMNGGAWFPDAIRNLIPAYCDPWIEIRVTTVDTDSRDFLGDVR